MAMEPESILNSRETALWRTFLTWSEGSFAAVERELSTTTGLSGADFQILARLSEAPEHSLGQKELSEALSWSASRLSHQLSRMEQRGYLTRRSAGEGRRMELTLTDDGLRVYTAALPFQAEAVRTWFLADIDPGVESFLIGRTNVPE